MDYIKQYDYLDTLLGYSLLILVWWGMSLQLEPSILPPPDAVFMTGIELIESSSIISATNQTGGPGLIDDLLYTTVRTLIGTTIGLSFGILIGLSMGWSLLLRDFFQPLIELLRAIPPLAYLPFFVVWFGIGDLSIIGLIVLTSALIIVVNTYEAVRNVEQVYTEFAQSLGASHNIIYRSVVIPSILPELTGGIRVALGLGWGLAVVAELLGAQVGVGMALSIWIQYQATAQIIAVVVAISTVAIIFDTLILKIIRKKTAWKTAKDGE